MPSQLSSHSSRQCAQCGAHAERMAICNQCGRPVCDDCLCVGYWTPRFRRGQDWRAQQRQQRQQGGR